MRGTFRGGFPDVWVGAEEVPGMHEFRDAWGYSNA